MVRFRSDGSGKELRQNGVQTTRSRPVGVLHRSASSRPVRALQHASEVGAQTSERSVVVQVVQDNVNDVEQAAGILFETPPDGVLGRRPSWRKRASAASSEQLLSSAGFLNKRIRYSVRCGNSAVADARTSGDGRQRGGRCVGRCTSEPPPPPSSTRALVRDFLSAVPLVGRCFGAPAPTGPLTSTGKLFNTSAS